MEALSASRHINHFYSHQVEAMAALSDGDSVIVSTSTASGKSVIYQVRYNHFSAYVIFMMLSGPISQVPGGGS